MALSNACVMYLLTRGISAWAELQASAQHSRLMSQDITGQHQWQAGQPQIG